MPAAKSDGPIYIAQVQRETIRVALVGTSPYYHHRLSPEQRGIILLPPPPKSRAEKQSTLKHEPRKEFHDSMYILQGRDPTLAVKSAAIKGAMMTGALDTAGIAKTQVGRLVYVHGEFSPFYGIPRLKFDDVRTADMNHTLDVRTRACCAEWAVLAQISFVVPNLTATGVLALLSNAGMSAGIGDFRPEKGKGSFGQFYVTTEDDPEFQRIRDAGGRDAQIDAIENVVCYGADDAELLAIYDAELRRRGR